MTSVNTAFNPVLPNEFNPLKIGSLSIWPPVVLAPMAGITNAPFRRLCREFGAGIFVSEMVTSRLLVEGNARTEKIAAFGKDETPRSIQLYGVDPDILGQAVKLLVEQQRIDHIDLNFGCPVRKVTRKGGGAAIPLKPLLFRNLVEAAVNNAGSIPVTVKFRTGIDEHYETYLQCGKIAEESGCAAVALHARSAIQYYDGQADWQAIKRLKEHVTSIPVLGNGDIWVAEDAVRMMRITGCDGVVVGRGCLGRPWLFRDLAALFNGQPVPKSPNLGEVVKTMLHHAEMLVEWSGEHQAMRNFRKHSNWYLKGFDIAELNRLFLMRVEAFSEMKLALDDLPVDVPYPDHVAAIPRGKSGRQRSVALPDGYLQTLMDATPPSADAEDPASGG